MSVAASTLPRLWMTRSTTTAPALEASSANSCRDSSAPNEEATRPLSSSPTRIARSRAVFGDMGISDLRGFLVGHCAGMGRCLGWLCRWRVPGVGVAALECHHRGDRMLEDELFLIVGLQHQRVFIEALDASRKLYATQQANRNDALFLARVV